MAPSRRWRGAVDGFESVILPLTTSTRTPVYWFLMQIGMIIGFGTAYPINIWLIKRGIKAAM